MIARKQVERALVIFLMYSFIILHSFMVFQHLEGLLLPAERVEPKLEQADLVFMTPLAPPSRRFS